MKVDQFMFDKYRINAKWRQATFWQAPMVGQLPVLTPHRCLWMCRKRPAHRAGLAAFNVIKPTLYRDDSAFWEEVGGHSEDRLASAFRHPPNRSTAENVGS